MTTLTTIQNKMPESLTLYKHSGEVGEKAINLIAFDDAVAIRLQEPVVNNQRNPRVSELTLQQLTALCESLVQIFVSKTWFKSVFGTGDEVEGNKNAFIASLLEDVHRECQYYRVMELEEAVRRGAHNRYPVENGLNNLSPVNMVRWFRAYRKERMAAIGKLQQQVEKLQAQQTPMLAQGSAIPERARSIYEHRKKCEQNGDKYLPFGMMNLFATLGYEFIECTGLFQISSKDKISAMDTALEHDFNAQLSLRVKGYINQSDMKTHLQYLNAYKAAKKILNTSLFLAMKQSDPSIVENPIFSAAKLSAKRVLFERKIMSVSAEKLREMLNEILAKHNYPLITA